jgi:SPP1 gp7 family putative phage head morphogenesis protein
MKLFFEPIPHQEALDFLRTRPAVTRAVFDDLSDELKAIAFVVTGIDDATQLQTVKNILSKLPAGTNYEDVKEQIIAVLPWAGPRAERRAELLLRHWGGIAYAAAQYRIMDRQRDVFPWWQYVTMGDGRVRATHIALNGIILRADSPFWQGHYPPWEPLCRCSVIPLSDADVEQIREEEKSKPRDTRTVLEGAILDKLLASNTLIRGMNNVYDVRTPAQKGASWVGWDPANLAAGLSIAKEQTRLSPLVFGKLMQFLKAQDLGQGVSVWDWWLARQPGGRPAAVPVPAAVPAPVPAPVPVPIAAAPPAPALPSTAAIPAGGKPVSAALPAGLPSVLSRAASLLDRVHGDGDLKAGAVTLVPGSSGKYSARKNAIEVGQDGYDPLAQFLHELGHKLDFDALPGAYFTSGIRGGHLADFFALAKQTKAWQNIRKEASAMRAAGKYVEVGYPTYLASDVEVWARAYTQFIIEETGDPALTAGLQKRLSGQTGYFVSSHWDAADFAPLRAEIRRLFVSLGWMTTTTPNPPTP